MRRITAALVVVALGIAGGCGSEQDPGVPPGSTGPTTTSRALAPCPPGGPDATTPAAGCLGEDGQVQRP